MITIDTCRFLVVLLMFALQGCIYWFPVDVDYEVEIQLNKERPDFKRDVAFVHCHRRSGMAWGYRLYDDGMKTNQVKVFLLPQELYDSRSMYGYENDCQPAYPSTEEIKSFCDVDLDAFTNSVRVSFEKMYRLSRRKESKDYMTCEFGENIRDDRIHQAGHVLYIYSCNSAYMRDDAYINSAMEHSLQAILLKSKYPLAPGLHERIVSLKGKYMLSTNPRFPLTTLGKHQYGCRYELRTDGDMCAGSMTVKYPFYMHLIEGSTGEEEATCAAMTQFLTMYCDMTKHGRYIGEVTAEITSCPQEDIRARIGKFRQVSAED